MSFCVVGASHKTASLALRERMTLGDGVDGVLLRRVKKLCGLDELAVLSTCNRIELYFRGDAGRVVDFLAERGGFPAREADGVVYRFKDSAAARHLLRVAAGLDSMILGETEVLSQCKAAYEAALSAGVTGPVLNAAFQRALVGAKKIHTKTTVSRGRVSVGSIAAGFVAEAFGDLSGRTVLVIGAGTMAKNALFNLSRLGPDNIIVANRGTKRGSALAARFGGRAVRLSNVARHLPEADVVVASAASGAPLLTRRAVAASQKKRSGRECLLIDIAVPRNISADVDVVDGVRLLNIDSMKVLAEENAARRKSALPAAAKIVEREADALMEYLAERRAAPVIDALGRKLAAIAAREVKKAEKRLKAHGRAAEELERLSQSITAKILHGPLSALKDSAAQGDCEDLAAAVKTLYALEVDDEAGPE
jgi:glutamyl-tRNA reductase